MALAIIDTVHNYAFTISNESIQKFDPQVDYVNNKTRVYENFCFSLLEMCRQFIYWMNESLIASCLFICTLELPSL